MSELTTFNVFQYLDSKGMTVEYLSAGFEDADTNELLEAIA